MNNSIPNEIILFYSKYSENSQKIIQQSTPIKHLLKFICLDNKDIRKLVQNNKKLSIQFVPSILLMFPSGLLEKYEGNKAFEWVENVVHNIMERDQRQQQLDSFHRESQNPPVQTPQQDNIQREPIENKPKSILKTNNGGRNISKKVRMVEEEDDEDNGNHGNHGNNKSFEDPKEEEGHGENSGGMTQLSDLILSDDSEEDNGNQTNQNSSGNKEAEDIIKKSIVSNGSGKQGNLMNIAREMEKARNSETKSN